MNKITNNRAQLTQSFFYQLIKLSSQVWLGNCTVYVHLLVQYLFDHLNVL